MTTAGTIRPSLSVAALLLVAATGCGSDDSASPVAATSVVNVSDAWSRQPAAGQSTAAVYAVVANPTGSDVTIVGASSPASDRVELHDTIQNADGTMQMSEAEDGFVVPAGGEFAFESAGPHIMLFDIDPATYPTDEVEVTLEFDTGDPITFAAEVRPLDGDDNDMGSMDMDHHTTTDDMGSMDTDHHTTTDDMGSMDMGDGMSDDADAIDPSALHAIDEELAAGELDADRQRAVIAPFIAHLEAEAPTAGSEQAELLTILQDLDAALADGDLAAAATAAEAAHEAAHALDHHA